jgi:hypothetical protein
MVKLDDMEHPSRVPGLLSHVADDSKLRLSVALLALGLLRRIWARLKACGHGTDCGGGLG